MHVVFTPPGESSAGGLDLPWSEPHDSRDGERFVEIGRPGLSRHAARSVAGPGHRRRILTSLPSEVPRT
ncbi:hypothetical protein [Actinomadura mexicana]|uniref:Uncharacterized protein n=1 Tax=Actinomadura mexicana TaxID=134959 RepID=A0A239CW23_9ACTN|nr:hypothetical protein [Actinomadura mexicana]SNS24300.1 hypothetical protein SAMN06265355_113146 [Actinomadura mexicana]